jgi:type IV pilus assembly protein PilC
MYPIIVVVFLAIAFIILLTGVIPKFVNIFKSAGLALPLPTQICMIMYTFLTDYWYLVIGGVVGGTVGLFYYFRTDQGRLVRDTTVMKIPILGPVFIKSAISRFASIFAILQSSGVDVLESFDILSGRD